MDVADSLTTAAEGMRVQADSLGVIAQNLANVSTAGFQSREAAFSGFQHELQTRVALSTAQGPLRRTGVPTDLGLSGPGFFALATADGVRYTRDGRMSVDPQGFLTDARGNRVLGSLGPVAFPHGASVTKDGSIVVDGTPRDRLRIVSFSKTCEAEGADGLLRAPSGCVPERAVATIHAGYLEDSGVDAISQMTAIIAVQRAYEANEKVVAQTDERLRRVVTDLPALHS
jgi:flagellar basal body rod protein FlgG